MMFGRSTKNSYFVFTKIQDPKNMPTVISFFVCNIITKCVFFAEDLTHIICNKLKLLWTCSF